MKIKIHLLLILFFSFTATSYSQLITDGLVAYYPFNNNIQDESNNGYDGQNLVGPIITNDRFGNPNSAFDFTTSDTYIDLGNILNDVFAGQGKQFSMSVWIKPHIIMTDGNIIAKVADTNCGLNQRMLFLKIYGPNNNIVFTYYSVTTAGNARRVMSNTEFTNTDKWYHVVVTYDGTMNTNDGKDRIKLFVDCEEDNGFLETSTGPLGDIPESTAHLGIGTYLDHNGDSCYPPHNFKGLIDEVYFFDRLLDIDEIQLLGKQVDAVNLGKDTVLCVGEQLILAPQLTNAIENIPLVWQDGSTDSEFTVSESGTYWVEAGTNCTLTDSIQVVFEICTDVQEVNNQCNFTIPTLLSTSGTPFYVKSNCVFKSYHLKIFSNTGQMVFESTDKQEHWLNSYKYPTGMYYYVLKYREAGESSENWRSQSGKLILTN